MAGVHGDFLINPPPMTVSSEFAASRMVYIEYNAVCRNAHLYCNANNLVPECLF